MVLMRGMAFVSMSPFLLLSIFERNVFLLLEKLLRFLAFVFREVLEKGCCFGAGFSSSTDITIL